MDISRQEIDRRMRAGIPHLEREIAELRPRVEATRKCNVLGPGFAHELRRREDALAAIRRDHM
jgi:hypothetical protein